MISSDRKAEHEGLRDALVQFLVVSSEESVLSALLSSFITPSKNIKHVATYLEAIIFPSFHLDLFCVWVLGHSGTTSNHKRKLISSFQGFVPLWSVAFHRFGSAAAWTGDRPRAGD